MLLWPVQVSGQHLSRPEDAQGVPCNLSTTLHETANSSLMLLLTMALARVACLQPSVAVHYSNAGHNVTMAWNFAACVCL